MRNSKDLIGKTVKFTYILSILLMACQSPEKTQDIHGNPSPLNIILLIGDGMGLSQVSASFYFKPGPSNFSRFPYIGLINTSSSSHKITDSAAGATAFATGKKTYNGAIGVDADTNALPLITEQLEDSGYRAGVIATSSITHATPASFFAHVESRHMHEEIAKQLTGSSIDFFAGGGLSFFIDREDGEDYYDRLTEEGFVMDSIRFKKEAGLTPDKKYGYLMNLAAMPRVNEGRGEFLQKATKSALDYFSLNESPFFLMVEGSQIDWGGHANDAEFLISEMIDFDQTVGSALDFAEKHGNTLVIVTADHETGGFTLASTEVENDEGEMISDYNKITSRFSTEGHTATLIPVFAYGPGAEAFTGVYDNTAVYDKMVQGLKILNK